MPRVLDPPRSVLIAVAAVENQRESQALGGCVSCVTPSRILSKCQSHFLPSLHQNPSFRIFWRRACITALMKTTITPYFICVFLLISAGAGSSAEPQSARVAGHRDYTAGEFEKAASHFERALKVEPNDADCYFWLGKSYEMLADIRGPLLGLRASVKARLYLAKALHLAPDNKDYRHELFQLLIVSDHSPGALRQAESIIQMTPHADTDFPFMLMRLRQEYHARSSPEGRIGYAFSVLPQQFARIAQ
jgi:tetratricopeptide (TPR) repeat protein